MKFFNATNQPIDFVDVEAAATADVPEGTILAAMSADAFVSLATSAPPEAFAIWAARDRRATPDDDLPELRVRREGRDWTLPELAALEGDARHVENVLVSATMLHELSGNPEIVRSSAPPTEPTNDDAAGESLAPVDENESDERSPE